MKYMPILRTTLIQGGNKPTLINWIRETEFYSHKKATRLKEEFSKESPKQKLELGENGNQYPVQFVSWEIISEKSYMEIKGE